VLAPPLPSPAPPAQDAWTSEPGFAPVALAEPPADEPGVWVAAAEAVDVTDATIDMPALAAMPRRRAARAGRAALTLALVLGCAGAAVAASGVLRSKPETSPPPTVSDSSVVAPARAHRAKPAHHKRVVHRHHTRHHRHRRAAGHGVAVAPRRIVAAAPAHTAPAAPAPVSAPVHRVSSPAPAPKPAPQPVASTPAASPQPAASAPSGEPGRQPPPSP
jgi:hypothetical protein